MSELVSAYPDLGRHLLVGLEARRGRRPASTPAGSTSSACSAIVASVAYGCATFFDLTLGTLQHVAGPRRLLAHAGLRDLPDRAGPRAAGQHLLQPPARHLQQHLGVVARGRRDGRRAHPAASSRASHQSVGVVFTDTVNNTGFFGGSTQRRGVPLLRAAAGVHPHAVHDHRLRRVRPPVRGDAQRGRLARPRASGGRSSTRRSAAGSCCWRSSSRCRTWTASPRPAAGSCTIFDQALSTQLGEHRAAHLHGRAVLLHRRLHDQLHADAVRVQPRRRRARRSHWSQAEPATGCRSTRVILRRSSRRPDHLPGAGARSTSTARPCRSPSSPSCRSASSGSTSPSRSRSSCAGGPATASRPGGWTLGHQVQVDVRRRGHRDRRHLDLRPAADLPRRARRGTTDFAWKYVNYTTDRRAGRAPRAVDLVARIGEELVHRAEDDHRPARSRRRGVTIQTISRDARATRRGCGRRAWPC